jgi:hypothetical protein
MPEIRTSKESYTDKKNPPIIAKIRTGKESYTEQKKQPLKNKKASIPEHHEHMQTLLAHSGI